MAELLAARLARQAVLQRKNPPAPLLWALLDEGVIHREMGGPGVMYDQLMSLVAVSELPSVSIQVVPYSIRGHSGLLGAFIIADFAKEPSIVFLENLAGGGVTEDAAVVAEAGVAAPGRVLVRDTTDRAGGTLAFTAEVWRDFTSSLR